MDVRDRYLTAKGVQSLIETEQETAPDSKPIRRRLSLWRRGFLSRSDVLYDFESHDYEDFVTDYERFVHTKKINGTWSVALSNKLFFDWLMRPYEDHQMTIYGLIRDGTFHERSTIHQSGPVAADGSGTLSPNSEMEVNTGDDTHNAGQWIANRLDQEEKLVLKWVNGGGGNNVLLCSRTTDGYEINGTHHSRTALASRVNDLENYLVCEYVEQGSYSAEFYPNTPNTLRLITMYDDEAKEAFIGAAIQRIGSTAAEPIDNFDQGGLNAEIDVETGTLGPGVQLPKGDTRLTWHTSHPDTGAQIEGIEIPAWESIRERICELASDHPQIPYVGWDLVITDDEGSFKIIEANSYPGLSSIQIHGPLLTDDRVRRFYERHGVC